MIVSRGELIEIGDGFRIPEIMQRSGAVLREVGTTNRTRIEDYREAINERTRLLLRVHPSNFRIEGFTARPELRELAALGRERGVPLYEDLGSGCVADLRAFGVNEPLVSDSLRAGVNLVSFSGDKLLGGPQAGILAGDREAGGAAATQSNVSRAAARQTDLSSPGDDAPKFGAGTLGSGSGAAHDFAIVRGPSRAIQGLPRSIGWRARRSYRG